MWFSAGEPCLRIYVLYTVGKWLIVLILYYANVVKATFEGFCSFPYIQYRGPRGQINPYTANSEEKFMNWEITLKCRCMQNEMPLRSLANDRDLCDVLFLLGTIFLDAFGAWLNIRRIMLKAYATFLLMLVSITLYCAFKHVTKLALNSSWMTYLSNHIHSLSEGMYFWIFCSV